MFLFLCAGGRQIHIRNTTDGMPGRRPIGLSTLLVERGAFFSATTWAAKKWGKYH